MFPAIKRNDLMNVICAIPPFFIISSTQVTKRGIVIGSLLMLLELLFSSFFSKSFSSVVLSLLLFSTSRRGISTHVLPASAKTVAMKQALITLIKFGTPARAPTTLATAALFTVLYSIPFTGCNRSNAPQPTPLDRHALLERYVKQSMEPKTPGFHPRLGFGPIRSKCSRMSDSSIFWRAYSSVEDVWDSVPLASPRHISSLLRSSCGRAPTTPPTPISSSSSKFENPVIPSIAPQSKPLPALHRLV
mmetsp:Transcript_20946/g.25685  ORF Transcript_20946/g.25685 Transcript_20946/m.25685 type:complete len:247 (-) Transcript_20946:34-774(-)